MSYKILEKVKRLAAFKPLVLLTLKEANERLEKEESEAK